MEKAQTNFTPKKILQGILLSVIPYLFVEYHKYSIVLFFRRFFENTFPKYYDPYYTLFFLFEHLQNLIINEVLIGWVVFCFFGKRWTFKYLKFSVMLILTTMSIKTIGSLTQFYPVQRLGHLLYQLGSNFEWLVFILASIYFISRKDKN